MKFATLIAALLFIVFADSQSRLLYLPHTKLFDEFPTQQELETLSTEVFEFKNQNSPYYQFTIDGGSGAYNNLHCYAPQGLFGHPHMKIWHFDDAENEWKPLF